MSNKFGVPLPTPPTPQAGLHAVAHPMVQLETTLRHAALSAPAFQPAASQLVVCAECGVGMTPRTPLYFNPPDEQLYCAGCWTAYYGEAPPPDARCAESVGVS
jgi:hypothetical protein